MPVTQLAGEINIIDKLKEIPGIDVLEGEYTPDSFVPTLDPVSKLFKPYLTVKFHPAIQFFDHGIADPSWDTQRASFSVFIVTPDDRLTRTFRDQVREKLLKNFRPTDGGYIETRGGFTFTDPDMGYHRYVQSLEFTYLFNLAP